MRNAIERRVRAKRAGAAGPRGLAITIYGNDFWHRARMASKAIHLDLGETI
jgi:hypothetical protein